jgi:integrase
VPGQKLSQRTRPKASTATGGLGLMATAPKGSLTVGQVAKEWLDTYVVRRKAATWVSYETTLRNHILPFIGDVKVRQGVLGTSVVLGLVDKLAQNGVSWPTQRVAVRVLSSLLQWALLYEHLLANPCVGMIRKLRNDSNGDYEEPEPNPLTREQADAFLTWVRTGRVVGNPDRPVDGPRRGGRWGGRVVAEGWARFYITFLLLFRTGMRRGEAAAVKWTDVFLERQDPGPQIELRKNASPAELRLHRAQGSDGETTLKNRQKLRTIDLSPELARELREVARTRREQALKERRPVSPYVCLGLNGQQMRASASTLDLVFAAGMKAIGLEQAGHTMHDTRDTFATCHLLINPGKLQWVSDMLGHKDRATTLRRYTKWVPTGDVGQRYAADLDEPAASDQARANAVSDRGGQLDRNRTPIGPRAVPSKRDLDTKS